MVTSISCEGVSASSWVQHYKTFYNCNLRMFVINECLSPAGFSKPILKFVGMARSLPQIGAPRRCFTRVGSGHTCKHQTRMERLAKDTHSSLLQTFVKYGRKSFITLGPVVVNELGNPKREKEVHWEKSLGHWIDDQAYKIKHLLW